MERFETPIDDPQVAEALRGLNYESVLLARNTEQSVRVHRFYDTFVTPETLEVETPEIVHVYDDSRRISALGDDGSLLHLRLHRQIPGKFVDAQHRYLAVIGHIDDPQPPRLFTAASEDVVRFDGTRQTTFTIGQPDEQGLQAVDDGMNQLQWEIEQVLARERAMRALPVVRITSNGWEYKRSDGHWEKLNDLERSYQRLKMAEARGFGHAALVGIEQNLQPDAGQFNQKVVV